MKIPNSFPISVGWSPDGSSDQYRVSDDVVIDEGGVEQLEIGQHPSAEVSSEPQSNQIHEALVLGGEAFTENSDAQGLLFEKTIGLWKANDSKEVFKKMPQNQHFEPLRQVEERSLREFLALGCMEAFARLVEMASELPASGTRSTVSGMIKTTKKLKEHGFDVEVFEKLTSEFLDVMDKEEKVEDEDNSLDKELLQCDHDNTRIEEEIREIKEQMQKLQEDQTKISEKVVTIKEQMEKNKQTKQHLRREFKDLIPTIMP